MDISFPYLAMTNKEFVKFANFIKSLEKGKILNEEQTKLYEELKIKSLGYKTNKERFQRY